MSGHRGFACDSCRRRRVRCDGIQPCERCERSGVTCTFGSLANRTSATSYARRLEQRIAQLESLLPHGQPNIDTQQDCPTETTEQAIDVLTGPGDDFVSHSMPDSVHVYRHYAAINILRILADLSGQHLHSSQELPTLGDRMLQAMDPHAPLDFGSDRKVSFPALPTEEQFYQLLDRAMATALLCHDCLDQEDISKCLPRLNSTSPEEYISGDRSFLALVYAIIACGRRYSSNANCDLESQGINEFRASCMMLDHDSGMNLNFIRTLILQTRFLMSLGRISAAYSTISTAAANARRMGLDKDYYHLSHVFGSEQRFRRRQVFAVLYMMDTYFDSILGMPKCLHDVASSQQLGLHDEDLEDEGSSFVKQNPMSSLAETVLCQKLYRVHVKMLDHEAAKSTNNIPEGQTAVVSWIDSREAEILQWANELPTHMDDPSDKRATNAQLYLRLHQAGAQIVLFRPFLRHLERDRSNELFNSKGYEYASKCVQAASQSIWVVESLKTYGIFHEAIWFNTYALAFSATILSYFVACSKQQGVVDESVESSINAISKARDMLRALAKDSTTSSTFYNVLCPIVDSLYS